MPATRPVIVWFRQDLRLDDNPAWNAAVAMQAPILPLYVRDDVNAGQHALGAASRWWVHQSLTALNTRLDGRMMLLRGDAHQLLPKLAANIDASGVFWNRCYEPWRMQRDKRVKAKLLKNGHLVRSFNGSLLFEPPHITKNDGTPYKVFTPYYRHGCLQRGPAPRKTCPAPTHHTLYRCDRSTSVSDLALLPKTRWHEKLADAWTPGERAAQMRMQTFISSCIERYGNDRDRPEADAVSRLSPHLHFGEVSPHTLWYAIKKLADTAALANSADRFLQQLAWREFSNYLLYYCPTLPDTNLQRRFDRFPWRGDAAVLEAWRRGRTGYPIVDAGMRELWQTGYMHNRVRMLAGSFLVKNLLQDWRYGAAWFWDTLVDADLANNSTSWQWIAGSGADAQPFARILDPVAQGRTFDPDGAYVRRYVPEIARLPSAYIHSPWEAPAEVLVHTGVRLGNTYPKPLVDLKSSRQKALEAYRRVSPSEPQPA